MIGAEAALPGAVARAAAFGTILGRRERGRRRGCARPGALEAGRGCVGSILRSVAVIMLHRRPLPALTVLGVGVFGMDLPVVAVPVPRPAVFRAVSLHAMHT